MASRTYTAEALRCFVPDSRPLAPTGDGALSGVGVALKDMFAVPGWTSSFGHPGWRATHEPARGEAAVVAALRAAGAAIAGLAKLDQLAYSLIGNAGEGEPPVNPADPERFAGGSSSGSASAVAGGVADLGVGTDTAGSIRVPAAACGLWSIRTTHGLVSTEGVLPLAPSLDVVGFLARAPALLADALTATAPAAAAAAPRLRRLVVADQVPAEDAVAVRRAAEASRFAVETLAAGDLMSATTGELFARIQGREIWREHGAWATEHMDELAADVAARLRRCEQLSRDNPDEVQADLARRDAFRRAVVGLLGDDAVLALPVLPRRGPLRRWSADELADFRTGCFRLMAPGSLAGVPEVVAPLPGGGALGFVGPPRSDRELLRAAAAGIPT